MQQVEIQAAPLEKLGRLLTPARADRFMATSVHARELLDGRVVWNVNATASGGGVAEMLQALLAYGRGADVDTRWLVLAGDPGFFAITKRVHNAVHGSPGDHSPLGAEQHRHYERVLEENLVALREFVRPGDIVLLHDPQTAGLVRGVRDLGAHVIWRSHIGRDEPNEETQCGWGFLRPYLEDTDAFVFSRLQYAPEWIPPPRLRIIAPSIDPFAAKNRVLDEGEVGRVLRRVGLIAGGDGMEAVEFTRRDGSSGLVRRHDDLLSGTKPPPAEAPLIVQVSRWDRLKDMAGVLSAFADHIAPQWQDVHLMLAGPDVAGVRDDPEGGEVLAACRATWQALPGPIRARCHLASIPMDDIDENAVVINALQRHATMVAQKSLVEGFGLTVAEAMWKSRPVVASAVGGILDQITDGSDGLLLPDPRDFEGFAERVRWLLEDGSMGARLGRNAHERVQDQFLGDRHLIQYVDLFGELIGGH
ncbi:MAG TPA: glycosyltransferase [Jatrophihabitans sp.]|nr:glycosyltransferase [Jatrophihabitans sp.]